MDANRMGARTALAVRAGRLAGGLSRLFRLGSGVAMAGRVALRVDPRALARLAAGRRVVLVTGTNGKTTTAHMAAAAVRTAGPVAHNDGGGNMSDGILAALMDAPDAPYAVLEVDELHVPAITATVHPVALILLNLTRDQLDRGTEVRAVARSISRALEQSPDVLVVANADDPVVVSAVPATSRAVWVAAGTSWLDDAGTCPACGDRIQHTGDDWASGCGLRRPTPEWAVVEGGVQHPSGRTQVRLSLPGRFNVGNAAMAMAAAAEAGGVEPDAAAGAIGRLTSVAGRYSIVPRGAQRLHLLLAKNPAGWAEAMTLLGDATAIVLAVNAHVADSKDTSWLWDVPFERFPDSPVVASGERAADVGLRLAYADREHRTEPDPLAALDLLPPGDVHVLANYTAFLGIRRRLAAEGLSAESLSAESPAEGAA
jgi:lipid II isoglutaminyl synthase (glutamine-hydrolysing)